ncbi:hypothetical protein [Varunaivibrio sulfuroxidans]|nr:hypothetical protein [Varunaivibrio sulfuroxidans]WES30245.1 hypothetical protein P3M64_11460 [Varunaivibrio sulfuroxidans]
MNAIFTIAKVRKNDVTVPSRARVFAALTTTKPATVKTQTAP